MGSGVQLPEEVHLLTLQPKSTGEAGMYVLRLQHLIDHDVDFDDDNDSGGGNLTGGNLTGEGGADVTVDFAAHGLCHLFGAGENRLK